MKNIILIISILIVSMSVASYFYLNKSDVKEQNIISNIKIQEAGIEIYASNLEVPWEIAFLPNQDMLVTLRKGDVLLFRDKEIIKTFKISEVNAQGEGGLLGIAVHPKFNENNFVYFYYTIKNNNKYENRVERYRLINENFEKDKIILSDIRGNIFHNAGKIEFGPDGYLYVTAGDALDEPLAQDKSVLAGKILRVDENGIFPASNPFNNEVYSLGHRNPQGLTWDFEGNLWSTEHGQSGINSGQDELNKIVMGGNYGWPKLRGSQNESGFISPEVQSGDEITWAPGDTEYYNGAIYFTGLRGAGLYKYEIETKNLSKFFDQEYGRLRAITLGPDGYFYIKTSNTDGRGLPKENDDKIIKVNPEIFN
jgi:glucose/arabinose dehydrogenase